MELFPDTKIRHVEPELMDDPGLSGELHGAALRGLARINAVSRSAANIWSELRPRLADRAHEPLRVLDLACGGGEVTLALARIARRGSLPIAFDGCDRSATALELASANATRVGDDSHFFRLDVLADPIPTQYDAIVSNLFLHHLSNEQAVVLLSRITAATRVAIVNDLARTPFGYAAAVIGTRVLSRSPIVHVDGPRSVRAAFTIEEAYEIARRAGMRGVAIRPALPWRWLLGWEQA